MIALSDQDLEQPKRILTLVASVLAMLALWCFLEIGALESRRDAHGALLRQTEDMAVDARQIKKLRAAPRLATDRERPNDELLAGVRDALAHAAIDSDHWIGNEPSPPVRLARSPYKKLNTRLSFEGIELRQLVELAHHLVFQDSSLNITSLKLSIPRNPTPRLWNVDVMVSYLIYAPYRHQAGPT